MSGLLHVKKDSKSRVQSSGAWSQLGRACAAASVCAPLFCALGLIGLAPACQSATLTLQNGTRQEIKGWGLVPGYASSDWNNSTTDEWTWVLTKPAIQQAIFNDLNYNIVRVGLPAKAYDASASNRVSTTGIADLKNLLQVAKDRGKTKWIMSIWSPPAAFKTPQVTWGQDPAGEGGKVRLNPDKVDDFTQYIVNCLVYLKSQGVGLPAMVTPQNEPDYATSYDSCFYGDRKSVYQNVVKSLRTRLNNAGLHAVQVGASEAGSQQEQATFLGDNFADMGSDTTLRDSINAVITHTYDDWSKDDAGYNAIKNMDTPNTNWGKPLWQTEYSLVPLQGESWSEIQAVVGTWSHLARDLTMTRYEYWLWWFGFTKGKNYYGNLLWGSDPASPQKLKNYYIFQKLWANVPAASGFKVQSFSSDDSAFIGEYTDSVKKHPVNYPDDEWGNKAIIRPVHMISFTNGMKTVFLVVNDTTSDKRVDIKSLPGSTYQRFETTESSDMADRGTLTVNNGGIGLSLGKQSVSIFVSNAYSTNRRATPASTLKTTTRRHPAAGANGVAGLTARTGKT